MGRKLFRGVSEAMHISGGGLVPRGHEATASRLHFHGLGLHGRNIVNASIGHQLNGKAEFAFLSFSTDFEVARYYALGRSEAGVVYQVDESQLHAAGVAVCSTRLKKSDAECLLWVRDAGAFPSSVIEAAAWVYQRAYITPPSQDELSLHGSLKLLAKRTP